MHSILRMLCLLVVLATAHAAVYDVGPGKPYTKITSVPALLPGDVVQIQPGVYYEMKQWVGLGSDAAPITFRGVGVARAIVDGTNLHPDGGGTIPRALFEFQDCRNIVIEHMEFRNATNSTGNGAGIRMVRGENIIVRDCSIHGNDDGAMGGPNGVKPLVFENCEIYGNGNPVMMSYTHNLYLDGTAIVIRNCYIHDPIWGQNVKVRAHYTQILNNYIADSMDGEIGLIDSPDTTNTTRPNSNAAVIGNVIVSRPRQPGYQLYKFIDFGTDLGGDHNGTLYLINNTCISEGGTAQFIWVSAPSARVKAFNNIFHGSPTIVGSTYASQASGDRNWMQANATVPATFTNSRLSTVPGFVDYAKRNYHLLPDSAARDIGLDAPTYVDGDGITRSALPLSSWEGFGNIVARPKNGTMDAGVYESIAAINRAPIANNGSVSVSAGKSVTITLAGSDPDGNAITYTLVSNPAHGTATLTGNTVVFAAERNWAGSYYGPDSFQFTVSDKSLTSTPATISINITQGPPLPKVTSFSPTSGNSNTKVTIVGTNFTDAYLVTVTGVAFRTITVVSPTVIEGYPAASTTNYGGQLSVWTPQGAGGGATYGFQYLATPVVGQVPIATAGNATVSAGKSVTITLAGSDPNGRPLTYALTSKPAHGTATLTGKTVLFAAERNWAGSYTGPDSFQFTVNNGTQTSAPATISINITPTPLPKVTSFSPTSGNTNTKVTIIGTNFTDAYKLTVTGMPFRTFTVISPTMIEAYPPATTTTLGGQVAVWAPQGSGAGAPYGFTVNPTLAASPKAVASSTAAETGAGATSGGCGTGALAIFAMAGLALCLRRRESRW